jgi:hypothetical protein
MTNVKNNQVPAPVYTLIETSRGNDPAIVVVNSALRAFSQKNLFPWHLSVSISCQLLGDRGMPTPEENKVLYELEDEISRHLTGKGNAIFLARVTCRGERDLVFRVHDPDVANTPMETLASGRAPLRQWEYRMEHDPDWNLAQAELTLLERDPKFN